MTRSVNVWKCFIIFGYILQPVYTGTTYTSKACYGTDGLVCTRHDLSCNSTKKIAISDAYYTNNTECTQTGLSNCGESNPVSVTEHGYHRFNNNELVSLYKNRSPRSQCVYRAPGRGATGTFSVVKYRCIEGITTESTNIRSPASTPSKTPTGVFMGGVAAGAVIVILVCLAVYVLVIRRRYDLTAKKQGDTPASADYPTNSGLSAGADVYNYTSIEHSSRSQDDTTHGSTATPDYQNI